MSKLKVLDLFSGIGGFSLGLERTGGFETVAFCEIEPFPRKVLAKHWPKVPIYEDVRTFEHSGPVDLVTAGFPCQDISFAGNGAGLSGDRSGLFWFILRAVRMVGQPKLLLENVAAILNRGMGSVLGAMAEVGYDTEWHCIPAKHIGAPHERDRLWLVAYPENNNGVHQSYRQEVAERLCDYSHYWASGSWNEANSKLCRMDDGIPDRVDRTSALGNAVVPQIPELIGNAILQSMRAA